MFGCFANEAWKAQMSAYGNTNCFVFKYEEEGESKDTIVYRIKDASDIIKNTGDIKFEEKITKKLPTTTNTITANSITCSKEIDINKEAEEELDPNPLEMYMSPLPMIESAIFITKPTTTSTTPSGGTGQTINEYNKNNKLLPSLDNGSNGRGFMIAHPTFLSMGSCPVEVRSLLHQTITFSDNGAIMLSENLGKVNNILD